MFTAHQDHQLTVRLANEIGVLAELAKVLADHGINILAISGAGEGDRGTISFVTDDNLRASDALKEHRYDPDQEAVVVLDAEHRPGLLRRITETLAHEGIDIHKIYASAASTQDRCFIVLHTADDQRALVALQQR